MSVTPTAPHVRPGPQRYIDQMTGAQATQYKERLEFLQDCEKAGRLKRGWKATCVTETRYSQPMVSNVLTGRIISPPVLDACYEVALKLLGEHEPKEIKDQVRLYSGLREELGQQIDELKQNLEDADLILMEKLATLQADHETWKQRQQALVRELEDRYALLSSRLEGAQLVLSEEETELFTRDGGELMTVEQLNEQLRSGEVKSFQ